jgi:AcrR family transcriptional regulator
VIETQEDELKRWTKRMTETTANRLVAAAMAEFNQDGFAATDSNKIARRAGFAPQTFYRWFKDKTDVFLAAYRQWSDLEITLLTGQEQTLNAEQTVEIIVRHHRDYTIFRRSLRALAVENPDVRAARAANRSLQLHAILQKVGLGEDQRGAAFALMLQIERLADALAEGECADLGVAEDEVRQVMVGLVAGFVKG